MNQERQPIRHTGTIKSYGTYIFFIYFYLSFIFVIRQSPPSLHHNVCVGSWYFNWQTLHVCSLSTNTSVSVRVSLFTKQAYLPNTLSVYMYYRQLKQVNNTNHKQLHYSHNKFTNQNRMRTNQQLFQFWNNISLKYWVSDCCLALNEHTLSYVMVITSCISMKWWCAHCTRATRTVWFL